jgi:hypothetical protein
MHLAVPVSIILLLSVSLPASALPHGERIVAPRAPFVTFPEIEEHHMRDLLDPQEERARLLKRQVSSTDSN